MGAIPWKRSKDFSMRFLLSSVRRHGVSFFLFWGFLSAIPSQSQISRTIYFFFERSVLRSDRSFLRHRCLFGEKNIAPSIDSCKNTPARPCLCLLIASVTPFFVDCFLALTVSGPFTQTKTRFPSEVTSSLPGLFPYVFHRSAFCALGPTGPPP